MIRLLSLFACFALMLSFVTASVAHAMDPLVASMRANRLRPVTAKAMPTRLPPMARRPIRTIMAAVTATI
jgi:hypothetical protein